MTDRWIMAAVFAASSRAGFHQPKPQNDPLHLGLAFASQGPEKFDGSNCGDRSISTPALTMIGWPWHQKCFDDPSRLQGGTKC